MNRTSPTGPSHYTLLKLTVAIVALLAATMFLAPALAERSISNAPPPATPTPTPTPRKLLPRGNTNVVARPTATPTPTPAPSRPGRTLPCVADHRRRSF